MNDTQSIWICRPICPLGPQSEATTARMIRDGRSLWATCGLAVIGILSVAPQPAFAGKETDGLGAIPGSYAAFVNYPT